MMEKTEVMKRYEEETGKQSAIVRFMAGGQALESKDFPKIGPYDYSTDYIAWLEAKTNISDEVIEAFQKIIRNQCDEISALKEKAEAYDRLMSGGKKTLKEWANIFGRPVVDSDGTILVFSSIPAYEGGYTEEGEFVDEWVGDVIAHIDCEYEGEWIDDVTLPDGW
jgi:hypothetical protein